jgi:hypothetical protein
MALVRYRPRWNARPATERLQGLLWDVMTKARRARAETAPARDWMADAGAVGG